MLLEAGDIHWAAMRRVALVPPGLRLRPTRGHVEQASLIYQLLQIHLVWTPTFASAADKHPYDTRPWLSEAEYVYGKFEWP